MQVTVQYAAQLAAAAGTAEETLELEESCLLLPALRHVAERHGPEFEKYLFDPGGALQSAVLLVVDDVQIMHGDDLVLENGNQVLIITPMAGG